MSNKFSDLLLFLREYVSNPKLVASIIPSSKHLGEALIRYSGASEAEIIVEVGTGTGIVTEKLCNNKRRHASFYAIEINPRLAEVTKQKCNQAEVICADAKFLTDILAERGLKSCQAVVSSLPWATLPEEEQSSLVESIKESLEPGAKFATFLFLFGLPLPSTKSFINKVKLEFSEVGFSSVVWRNFPPAIVLWARK